MAFYDDFKTLRIQIHLKYSHLNEMNSEMHEYQIQ